MSELRPSFEERDKYLALLSQAYADGRLDDVEFRRRSDGVLEAVTHRDAMEQFEGLPKPNVLPAPVYMPPVQPGPPAPPPQFGHLPSPQVRSDPMTDRRAILIFGGLGLAAVLGVGLFGVTSVPGPPDGFPVILDDSDPWAQESFFATDPDPYIWPEWVMLVAGESMALGFEQFSSLDIDENGLRAELFSTRDGGMVTDLEWSAANMMSYGEERPGTVGSAVPVEEVEPALRQALDNVHLYKEGNVSAVNLVWGPAGEPRIRLTTNGGERSGAVTFDMVGTMVSTEGPG